MLMAREGAGQDHQLANRRRLGRQGVSKDLVERMECRTRKEKLRQDDTKAKNGLKRHR